LTSLVLEKNNIANDGARTLISSFGSNVGARLDLRLRGNPFDYSKIAFEMAVSKGSVELERDELQKECERLRTEALNHHHRLHQVMAAQALMVSDMHVLKQQAACLAEERETLSNAFSVLGKVQQVEERKQMLNRIGKLEEMVLGNTAFATFPSSSPKQPSDSSGRRAVTTQSLSNIRSVSRHTSMPSIGEKSDGNGQSLSNIRSVSRHTSMPSIGEKSDGSGRRTVISPRMSVDRSMSRHPSISRHIMPSIGEEQAPALNASNISSSNSNSSNNNMHEQRRILKRSTSLELQGSKYSVPLYTSHSNSLPQILENSLQRSTTSAQWGVSDTKIPKGDSSSSCSTVSSPPKFTLGGRQQSLPQLGTQAASRGARSHSLDI
jgi:hypothetical protein